MLLGLIGGGPSGGTNLLNTGRDQKGFSKLEFGTIGVFYLARIGAVGAFFTGEWITATNLGGRKRGHWDVV